MMKNSLDNSGREGIAIVFGLRESQDLNSNADLMNHIRIAVVFKTSIYREKKAIKFGSVPDSSLVKVVSLFIFILFSKLL